MDKIKADPEAGKAPGSTRSLWKGAISFGLVHVPVALFSATSETDLNFKMIDKRSMDPVGYKKINKKTGKDVTTADVVKGVEWEDGSFVLVSPEEIEKAYPKTTQTIEIEAFVPIDEVPFVYLEKPYYTAPVNKGQKVYALLREALASTSMVGVAKVVISNKQHLALLMPCGPALVLNLLRWGGEIRSWSSLQLPPQGVKESGIKDSELTMAKQLIKDMTSSWNADHFRDSFHDAIMRLVENKAKSGQVEQVEAVERDVASSTSGQVLDLTELLKRSLAGGAKKPVVAPVVEGAVASKTPATKTSSIKKLPAKKTPAKKSAPKLTRAA